MPKQLEASVGSALKRIENVPPNFKQALRDALRGPPKKAGRTRQAARPSAEDASGVCAALLQGFAYSIEFFETMRDKPRGAPPRTAKTRQPASSKKPGRALDQLLNRVQRLQALLEELPPETRTQLTLVLHGATLWRPTDQPKANLADIECSLSELISAIPHAKDDLRSSSAFHFGRRMFSLTVTAWGRLHEMPPSFDGHYRENESEPSQLYAAAKACVVRMTGISEFQDQLTPDVYRESVTQDRKRRKL